MNYYEVAALSYLGESDILTYHSEELLEIGDFVNVSVRNKNISGIIINIVKKPTFNTKSIISKSFDKPILRQELIDLAFWIKEYYGASLPKIFETMLPKGITKKRREIKNTETYRYTSEKLKLTPEQKKVFDSISGDIYKKPHLLFGVTGSGKTEIYLQLIEKLLNEGKQAIVLVPEISLTPQTKERFESRFPGQVSVLHSYLKETERFKNWKDIFDGKKNIVIGSRSALFAPCKNLGIIIIDEEHESSYKQDQTPRYQTVSTAVKLAKLNKCGLVLGSATPRIEDFFNASSNEYLLHTLSKRIVQDELPKVKIIDMRNEFMSGNYSIFSEQLKNEMAQILNDKKQILLFLNRRGMSTFVSCRECGHVESCPNCDISLTFHLKNYTMTCHHCGYTKIPPTVCPECKSLAIKYFGTGTQRVEEELKKIFGKTARIERIDNDSITKENDHESIFNRFLNQEIDILIGTQIITKGWDISNVGLVGVISADTAINFPDYTSGERTFSLLTQVAGRTGRGKEKGKVIIQTYNPDYYAIKYASKHDYWGFYNEEIEIRKELSYPPFAVLIKLMYNNSVQLKAKSEAERLNSILAEKLTSSNISFKNIGPAPAFIPRINNKFYYQISIKVQDNSEDVIKKTVNIINEITNNNWSIDVEPGDLL